MSFPVGASVGDKYTLGNIQYEFNGVAWDLAGSVAGNAVEEIESRVTTNESSIDNIDTRVTTVENNKLDTTDLLTEMKAVDGEGSGLDADLVKGLPADFTSSLSENGYQILPSGLIIQWGKTAEDALPDNGHLTITFPIAFTEKCLNVTVSSLSRNGVNVSTGVGGNEHVPTKTDFIAENQSGSTNGAMWVAIGY